MGAVILATALSTRRAGLSVVYVVVMLVGLIGFVSLAVDVGRIRLARTELQLATDAAARAGARSLPVSTSFVLDNTVNTAYANTVIDAAPDSGRRTNTGVDLDDEEDIEFGTWDPGDREFTPTPRVGRGQDERRFANSVHVIGRRTEARDNPIPLIFGPVVGVFSHDIEREAIAYITGGPSNFGFVGLDWVSSNGTGATINSMLYGDNGTGGGVGSDGDINLGNGDVYGDARAGADPGDRLSQGPRSIVTGWAANLDYRLRDRPEYQPRTTPAGITQVSGPNGSQDWILPPSGISPSNDPDNPRRLVRRGDVDLRGNADIRVTGYVELYVEGDFDVQGNHDINTSNPRIPARLKVIVVGNRDVEIGGNASSYMHLFAPQSTVRVYGSNNMHFYGRIVGRTLSFIGGSNLHYDESGADKTPYKIQLVR